MKMFKLFKRKSTNTSSSNSSNSLSNSTTNSTINKRKSTTSSSNSSSPSSSPKNTRNYTLEHLSIGGGGDETPLSESSTNITISSLNINKVNNSGGEELIEEEEEQYEIEGGEQQSIKRNDDIDSSDEVDNMYSSNNSIDDNINNDDNEEIEEEMEEEEEEEEEENISSQIDDDEEEEDFNGFKDVESELNQTFFKTLSTQSEVVEQQKIEINQVAQLLSIDFNSSHTLLKHFNWKKEKLLTEYFESTKQVCSEAGIEYRQPTPFEKDDQPQPQPQQNSTLSTTTSTSTTNTTSSNIYNLEYNCCTICGDDDESLEMTSLQQCKHSFCNSCWAQYLAVKISEGEGSIRCPAGRCTSSVDDHTIQHLVAPFLYDKYQSLSTKKFLQHSHQTMKWCPTPGCESVVTLSNDSEDTTLNIVQCAQCLLRFCLKCHRESHLPTTCEQMNLWDQKCKDESETSHWKSVNCKQCPKCQTSIEKNGGCLHMSCKQCSYEWCWVCLRSWKGHTDYYLCSRLTKDNNKSKSRLPWFGKSKKQKEIDQIDEKKRNNILLLRYIYYYEKYMNHDNSRKIEKEIRQEAKSKMDELEKLNSTWAEVQFIYKGVEQLLNCRSVLKHTYIYSYFSFGAEELEPRVATAKDLFEFLQDDLEKTTERLAELMEEIMKKGVSQLSSQRMAIMNQTAIANSKIIGIIQAVTKDSLFNN